MASNGLTNVAILRPSTNVSSLSDELQDGQVQQAVDAALAAYKGLDSDGDVPVVEYDTDLAGALRKATEVANASKGNDLLVVVSDGVTSDRDAVRKQIDALVADDNGVVIVDVNNQRDTDVTAFLEELDNDGKTNKVDRVDVLQVKELPGTEVQSWFA